MTDPLVEILTVEYVDVPLRFDQWTDAERFPEYACFQLLTGEYRSDVVWAIIEDRRSQGWHNWEAYKLALRRVFGLFWYFASHNKGLPKRAYKDLTARRLNLTTRDVMTALNDAKLMGIPALMGISEAELARVM